MKKLLAKSCLDGLINAIVFYLMWLAVFEIIDLVPSENEGACWMLGIIVLAAILSAFVFAVLYPKGRTMLLFAGVSSVVFVIFEVVTVLAVPVSDPLLNDAYGILLIIIVEYFIACSFGLKLIVVLYNTFSAKGLAKLKTE